MPNAECRMPKTVCAIDNRQSVNPQSTIRNPQSSARS
jgi:hypothetical protein